MSFLSIDPNSEGWIPTMPSFRFAWLFVCVLVPITVIVFSWGGYKHHQIKTENNATTPGPITSFHAWSLSLRRFYGYWIQERLRRRLHEPLYKVRRCRPTAPFKDEEAVNNDVSRECLSWQITAPQNNLSFRPRVEPAHSSSSAQSLRSEYPDESTLQQSYK